MRKELYLEELIITYGCSAHLLNLLAQDLQIRDIKEHVTDIIKYFRNHQFPGSVNRNTGGTALVMPADTRWNTVADSVESYLKIGIKSRRSARKTVLMWTSE